MSSSVPRINCSHFYIRYKTGPKKGQLRLVCHCFRVQHSRHASVLPEELTPDEFADWMVTEDCEDCMQDWVR